MLVKEAKVISWVPYKKSVTLIFCGTPATTQKSRGLFELTHHECEKIGSSSMSKCSMPVRFWRGKWFFFTRFLSIDIFLAFFCGCVDETLFSCLMVTLSETMRKPPTKRTWLREWQLIFLQYWDIIVAGMRRKNQWTFLWWTVVLSESRPLMRPLWL